MNIRERLHAAMVRRQEEQSRSEALRAAMFRGQEEQSRAEALHDYDIQRTISIRNAEKQHVLALTRPFTHKVAEIVSVLEREADFQAMFGQGFGTGNPGHTRFDEDDEMGEDETSEKSFLSSKGYRNNAPFAWVANIGRIWSEKPIEPDETYRGPTEYETVERVAVEMSFYRQDAAQGGYVEIPNTEISYACDTPAILEERMVESIGRFLADHATNRPGMGR